MTEQMIEQQAVNRASQLGLHPLRSPLDDSHHSDVLPTQDDLKIGDAVAWFLGDTFLDVKEAPVIQWTQIVKALRIHGLKIVDAKDPPPSRKEMYEALVSVNDAMKNGVIVSASGDYIEPRGAHAIAHDVDTLVRIYNASPQT